ncbi:MAG: cyclic nucleotide-binding domain-containing protein, partial [Chloroflexota bacterium]
MTEEPNRSPEDVRAPDEDLLSLLAANELLGLVPAAEREMLAPHFHLSRYQTGENIVSEGEAGNAFYLIGSGTAAVVGRDLIGGEKGLASFGRGDHFGEMALVTGALRSATVRATGPVEAYFLTGVDFAAVESSFPAFTAELLRRVDLLAIDGFLKRASPFAHLSAPELRTLAAQLTPVRVPAGEVVFREGDAGDRFYLVVTGSVELSRGGSRLQVMEAGDCFGEVALLTAEKRTATVRALVDTGLLSLEKHE